MNKTTQAHLILGFIEGLITVAKITNPGFVDGLEKLKKMFVEYSGG